MNECPLEKLSPNQLQKKLVETFREAIHISQHLEMSPFDITFAFIHAVEEVIEDDDSDEEEEHTATVDGNAVTVDEHTMSLEELTRLMEG